MYTTIRPQIVQNLGRRALGKECGLGSGPSPSEGRRRQPAWIQRRFDGGMRRGGCDVDCCKQPSDCANKPGPPKENATRPRRVVKMTRPNTNTTLLFNITVSMDSSMMVHAFALRPGRTLHLPLFHGAMSGASAAAPVRKARTKETVP